MSAPAAILSVILILTALATRHVDATSSIAAQKEQALKSFQIGAAENYFNRVNLKETLPTTTRIWRTSQPGVSINRGTGRFVAADLMSTTPISSTITNANTLDQAVDPSALSMSMSNHGNKTRMEILEENLGPQKKPIGFVISMSTVYILILICGLVGNISTCCVIICNNCMHTTTNYYLFSLAVSDVLSLITGKLE